MTRPPLPERASPPLPERASRPLPERASRPLPERASPPLPERASPPLPERAKRVEGPPELDESAPRDYEAFRDAVYTVAESIPPGHVMSYGEVAAAVGSRAARAVGRIMAHSGGELPWWRVAYADGHLLPGYEAQARDRYRDEGTPMLSPMRIDMRRARWSPSS